MEADSDKGNFYYYSIMVLCPVCGCIGLRLRDFHRYSIMVLCSICGCHEIWIKRFSSLLNHGNNVRYVVAIGFGLRDFHRSSSFSNSILDVIFASSSM